MAFNPAFLGLGFPSFPFSLPSQTTLSSPQFLKNVYHAIKIPWKRHRPVRYFLRKFIQLCRCIAVVYDTWCSLADFRWLLRWFPFGNDDPAPFSNSPTSCNLYSGNTSRSLSDQVLHDVGVAHASTSDLSTIPKSGAKLVSNCLYKKTKILSHQVKTATKAVSTSDIGYDESFEHDWLPPRFKDSFIHVTFEDDPKEEEISPPSSPAYYSSLNEEPVRLNPLPPPPRPKRTPTM